MLRHTRLGDAELGGDDGADLAGGPFSLGEQLENAPPDGVAQHIKGVHRPILSPYLYKSRLKTFVPANQVSDTDGHQTDAKGNCLAGETCQLDSIQYLGL